MAKTDTPTSPSWQSVLLVCKQCGKRSSGPKSLKAKEVVHELRQAARAERPRPRVLTTGCLGLCPKKALAIARVGGGAARIAAVKSKGEVTEALSLKSA